MTETRAPLPCPWCGSKAVVDPDPSVACINGDCQANGPLADTEAEAIAAWNRIARPTAAVTAEAVERAVEAACEAFIEAKHNHRGITNPPPLGAWMRAGILAALPLLGQGERG